MRIDALCWTCAHRHAIDFDPLDGYGSACLDWQVKHSGHDVEFRWPQRSERADPTTGDALAGLLHNADAKIAYGASAAPTLTLASLAASSAFLAGRESTAVSNATNKYLDMHVAGFFKSAATNNQAGYIRVHVVGALDDTPTWPDVFDGTDSTETVSLAGVYNSVCRIIAEVSSTNAASTVWPFGPVGVAAHFGGWLPVQQVFFISHTIQTSTNAWDATEGSHSVKYTPLYATVV